MSKLHKRWGWQCGGFETRITIPEPELEIEAIPKLVSIPENSYLGAVWRYLQNLEMERELKWGTDPHLFKLFNYSFTSYFHILISFFVTYSN